MNTELINAIVAKYYEIEALNAQMESGEFADDALFALWDKKDELNKEFKALSKQANYDEYCAGKKIIRDNREAK